jgi:hypothetical protein
MSAIPQSLQTAQHTRYLRNDARSLVVVTRKTNAMT